MISNVLSDAVAQIDEYLESDTYDDHPLLEDIAAVQVAMNDLRIMLDRLLPETSAEEIAVWRTPLLAALQEVA